MQTCQACFNVGKQIQLGCSCSFCSDCIHAWIMVKVPEFSVSLNIPCLKCKGTFDPAIILHLFNRAQQQSINQLLLKTYLIQTNDIRICPTENCMFSGTINLREKCHLPLECEVCGAMWRDPSCNSMNKTNRLRRTLSVDWSEIWKRLFAKNCPSCGLWIQKTEGCSHMICTKCKYGFCWICLANWNTHKGFPCRSQLIQNGTGLLFLLIMVILLLIAVHSCFGTIMQWVEKLIRQKITLPIYGQIQSLVLLGRTASLALGSIYLIGLVLLLCLLFIIKVLKSSSNKSNSLNKIKLVPQKITIKDLRKAKLEKQAQKIQMKNSALRFNTRSSVQRPKKTHR